jgi:uncharacterized protein (TIGR03067 family)
MIDVHPDPDRLAAFRLGKVGEDELAEIESHVARCDRCCRSLKGLPDDSFVSLVRQLTGRTPATPSSKREATWDQADTMTEPEPEVPPDLRDHPRYQILDRLGQGGMGVIYKARHRLMERVVALKVLPPRLLDRPDSVERFRREVKGAARLSHANIVTAHDADQAGSLHFLVMEYVPGISLARLVEEQGPLPVPKACAYIRQAALGLAHAHECGMVHRDIKPQNLMVVQEQLKILDFGLARFVSEVAPAEVPAGPEDADPAGRLTQAGTVMGTPDYIAPEQARAAHTADIRADIYSLGCTLYYLLAGHGPFPKGSAAEKISAHQEQAPRPLGEIRPDVPAGLAHVLDRMLAKDPAQRFQTPAKVAEALAPWTTAPVRRRRLLVSLGLGALAVLVAVIVLVVLHLPAGDRDIVSEPDDASFQGKRSAIVRLEEKKSPGPKARDIGFVPLFNGKDLSGWEGDLKAWTWKEGALVGDTALGGRFREYFLWSAKKLKDFELKFKVRLENLGGIYCGLAVRSQLTRNADQPFAQGPEVAIGKNMGGFYTPFVIGRNLKRPRRQDELDNAVKVGFNDFHVKCVGKHVTIRINGVTTIDDDFADIPDAGILAFHLVGFPEPHHWQRVTFKDIQVRELPTPAANPPRPMSDAEKLKGPWVLIFAEHEGKPLPADKIPKMEIRFGTTDFELIVPGQKPERLQGTFKVDPEKKQILLQLKPDGVKAPPPGMPCSYRWEKDRLSLELPILAIRAEASPPPAPKPAPSLRLEFQRPASSEGPTK